MTREPGTPGTLTPGESSPLLQREDCSTKSRPLTPTSSDDDATVSSPVDEEARHGSSPEQSGGPQLSKLTIFRILCILLIGSFVGNADGSLVMATHPIIASEFDALESSSWLFTAFGLAGASTQSIIAKLSDIYGRKFVVIACYTLFALGCVIVGLGRTMFVVIIGRIVSGAVGGGMGVLVSICIADLVPIREMATWRAYTNVVSTTARSLGGPLGGWLTDAVGWRWSFLGQVPLFLLGIVLCVLYLPSQIGATDKAIQGGSSSKSSSKFERIDFLGSLLLFLLILSFLLPMEIGGVHVRWSHPLIGGLLGSAVVFLVLFVFTEKRIAKEPIFPIGLFAQREVVASFLITSLQIAAQVGMMFCVPMYFQVTKRVSSTEAGAHLFPAVTGNAVGGIISGVLIKRFGKYKWLTYFGTLSACLCYTLLLWRWHGNTNWWESLYIAPGGFGTGVVSSSVFIALQAAVDKAHVGPAISGMYLASQIGSVVGLACMSATLQGFLRRDLVIRLSTLGLDVTEQAEIISKAVSNVEYVYQTTGKVGEAIVASYVDGLWYTHAISLLFSFIAFLAAFVLRERPL